MNFTELKEERKKKLEEAINEYKKLVACLEKEFDDIEKFKIGNIIEYRNDSYKTVEYLIITDNPILGNDNIKIPVRHHVYGYTCGGNVCLNFSGAIDLIEIHLDKIKDVKVITINEFFILQKDKIYESFQNEIKSNEKAIRCEKERIEESKKRIQQLNESIAKMNNIDFDSEFTKSINKYIDSRYMDAIDVKRNYGDYLSYGSRVYWKIE